MVPCSKPHVLFSVGIVPYHTTREKEIPNVCIWRWVSLHHTYTMWMFPKKKQTLEFFPEAWPLNYMVETGCLGVLHILKKTLGLQEPTPHQSRSNLWSILVRSSSHLGWQIMWLGLVFFLTDQVPTFFRSQKMWWRCTEFVWHMGFWVNTVPLHTILSGMNIHFNPAILRFTFGTRVLTHPHVDHIEVFLENSSSLWGKKTRIFQNFPPKNRRNLRFFLWWFDQPMRTRLRATKGAGPPRDPSGWVNHHDPSLVFYGPFLRTYLAKQKKNFKEASTPTTPTLPTQDVNDAGLALVVHLVCLQSAGAALKTEVMPALSRFFKLFRLPDERELNEMWHVTVGHNLKKRVLGEEPGDLAKWVCLKIG